MKQVHDRPMPSWPERLAVATFLTVVGLLTLSGLFLAVARQLS
jgi:hypothetical protein